MSVGCRLSKSLIEWALALLILPQRIGAAELQLQFVKPAENANQPKVALALRISGQTPPDAELHIYGLVNHDPNRDYQRNEPVVLGVFRGSDLSKPLIPIPLGKQTDILEVTATLTRPDGYRLSEPARYSFGIAPLIQAGPSALQSLINSRSSVLGRWVNLFDSFRADADEPRLVFIATRTPGKSSKIEPLALQRAQYRALGLSPDGERIAWTVTVPEGYELWTSPVSSVTPARLDSSPDEIITPKFADQNILLYVNRSALLLADTNTSAKPRAVAVPFVLVARIYWAQREGPWITAVVRAEQRDKPGIDAPFLIKIPPGSGPARAVRLAENSFYEWYSLLVEDTPFFFAGTERGVEGILSLDLKEPGGAVTNFFTVRSPGLVALSANGKRLAFVGNP